MGVGEVDGQLGSTMPGVQDGELLVGGLLVGGLLVGGVLVGGVLVGGVVLTGAVVVGVLECVGVGDAAVEVEVTGVFGALISCLLGSGRLGLPDK